MDSMNSFYNSRFVVYAKAPEDCRFYATGLRGYKVNKMRQARYKTLDDAIKIAKSCADLNVGWAFQIREIFGNSQKIIETIGEHDPSLAVDHKDEARKRKETERKDIASQYFGFGENLNAALFAKVCIQLKKSLCYNDPENGLNGILTNAEFVEIALKNGFAPKECKRLGRHQDYWTTPEKDYIKYYMITKNGVGYTVNKTVYNYAVFLQSILK